MDIYTSGKYIRKAPFPYIFIKNLIKPHKITSLRLLFEKYESLGSAVNVLISIEPKRDNIQFFIVILLMYMFDPH